MIRQLVRWHRSPEPVAQALRLPLVDQFLSMEPDDLEMFAALTSIGLGLALLKQIANRKSRQLNGLRTQIAQANEHLSTLERVYPTPGDLDPLGNGLGAGQPEPEPVGD